MKRLYDISEVIARSIDDNLVSDYLSKHILKFITSIGQGYIAEVGYDFVAPYDLLSDTTFSKIYLQLLTEDQKKFLDKHIISIQLDISDYKERDRCDMRVKFCLDTNRLSDVFINITLECGSYGQSFAWFYYRVGLFGGSDEIMATDVFQDEFSNFVLRYGYLTQ